MRVIVVAAKAGEVEEWVADAAAEVASQTGATVKVVSVDGLDLEALASLPRSEFTKAAQASAETMTERIRAAGAETSAETLQGPVVRGILLYAEEQDADLIIVGASSRRRIAQRLFGDVPLELVQRSRRPVLVIAPPAGSE
jgi:nucleotide-binding universal stress UspA family protein